MIFEKQIGVKLHVSASVGAIILILTGVISEKEALRSIDLKTVFLFGGSLALASALETTGAGTLVADAIIHALGDTPSPFLLLLVIWIVTCALTNFMSNTATTALMVPIAVALAQGVGADPRAVVVATVIAGSRLRDAHRHAGKHHGRRHRRIFLQGLCEGRPAADRRVVRDLHGAAADPLPILPRIILHGQICI